MRLVRSSLLRVLALALSAAGLAVVTAPGADAAGPNAVQDLSYCTAGTLAANDDSSTGAIAIPFELKFFGSPYTELYVNNNGNITFGASQSEFTPSDLTGPTNQPIIAPFFADVDTQGALSKQVTYGSSPDGTTFCVNWVDVGYFSSHDDKLNSVQLLLTKHSAGFGRVAGDFDITFNYDRVTWETGDASGGANGLGGTSAAVGFSNGSGGAGTYVQLPGSLTNGALLDGGPNALVAGSQASGHNGRYTFEVRNDGFANGIGSMTGTVVDGADAPVAGAYVEACKANGACSYGDTDGAGAYAFTGIPAGQYQINVTPPTDALYAGGGSATVVGGQSTLVPKIVLGAPVPKPANVSLTNRGSTTGGVPIVYYHDDLDLVVTGCPGVLNPSYTVLLNGTVIRNQVAMSESPTGTYHATIPAFYPQSGDAEIRTNIPANCSVGTPNTVFDVYIDPSGIVTDQYGRTITGATVTLLRSDTQGGIYNAVPDGSPIMSPSNRANPSTTDATGFFHWDVNAGWYEVRATAPGCTAGTTSSMQVPPERIQLLIKLVCSAAAPAANGAPSVSGTPRTGQTLTALGVGGWTAPVVNQGLTLLRNGTPLNATTYTLVPGDVGATFAARATGARPSYTQENGSGSVVAFDTVSVTSSDVVAQNGNAPSASKAPVVSGTPRVGQTLTVADPVWSPAADSTRQWLRDGAPIAGATGTTYALGVADLGHLISVKASSVKPGYDVGSSKSNAVKVTAAVSSTSAKLKPGQVAAGKAAKIVVTVKAAGVTPDGKVKIKKAGKTIAKGTLKLGKVTITLPKLKTGTYKLTAVYKGSAVVLGSTSKVAKLKVV